MWLGISVYNNQDHHAETEASLFETLKTIPAQLSMLTFFLYGGVELGLGMWIYSLLTESRGVALEVAGFIAGSYWGMFTVGRIIAGLYTKKIADRKLIYLSVCLALLGIGLLITNSGQLTSIIGIGVAGLAIAPIFPGLVSNTASRVGQIHNSNTIGLQIAASGFGIAIVPSLAGLLAKIYGLEAIPLYLLIVLSLMLLVFAAMNFQSNKKAR